MYLYKAPNQVSPSLVLSTTAFTKIQRSYLNAPSEGKSDFELTCEDENFELVIEGPSCLMKPQCRLLKLYAFSHDPNVARHLVTVLRNTGQTYNLRSK